MLIDWPGIRAAAVALNSVNAAAIQAGANLSPEDQNTLRERINKRALRQQWMTKAKAAVTASHPAQSKLVQTGADALQNIIQERKHLTRLHLSKYAEEAAHVAAQSKGNHKLSRSTKDIADIMGKVWPEQAGSGTGGINVAILTGQAAIQFKSQD